MVPGTRALGTGIVVVQLYGMALVMAEIDEPEAVVRRRGAGYVPSRSARMVGAATLATAIRAGP
ncbi:MAG: hypothetical protein JWO98_559 [Frankiales bacterium]|nr:hypothetical protein [Frankiales bacterium]